MRVVRRAGLYSSRIVALLLTFCFEPCLAVVQALSREFSCIASYFLEKVSSKSELGLRPISPADQSYRVHLLVRNSAACGRYGGPLIA